MNPKPKRIWSGSMLAGAFYSFSDWCVQLQFCKVVANLWPLSMYRNTSWLRYYNTNTVYVYISSFCILCVSWMSFLNNQNISVGLWSGLWLVGLLVGFRLLSLCFFFLNFLDTVLNVLFPKSSFKPCCSLQCVGVQCLLFLSDKLCNISKISIITIPCFI